MSPIEGTIGSCRPSSPACVTKDHVAGCCQLLALRTDPSEPVPVQGTENVMGWIIGGIAIVVVLLALSVRIVKQYEQGVLFRLGRVVGVRRPGMRLIIP